MTDGYYYCLNCHSEITPDYNEHCTFCGNTAIAVGGDYDNEEVERAFDLLNKEQQGFTIETSCKVGSQVFFIQDGEVRCGEIIGFELHKEPELILKNAPITETYYVNSAVLTYPLGCCEMTPFKKDDIGKTIFLTSEAAEKALEDSK